MIPEGLKYTSDEEHGLIRKRWGRGYVYLTEDERKVEDENTIQRIKDLVIPPNWKKVWICKDSQGHLQATGYDEKGRKQYLYHEEFSAYRQTHKYDNLYEFGSLIPVIRAKVARDLKSKNWTREKVLALAVRIMDNHHFRVGSEKYRDENETYGITTLRRKHLEEADGAVKLSYKAKSGKYREVSISNSRIQDLILESSDLPGHELFRYEDDKGKYKNITSHDVNEYIRGIVEADFTAKHFRTWGGTVAVMEEKEAAQKEITENPRKKLETALIRRVAERLGNTVSTCREYYIHPKVMTAALEGQEIEINNNLIEELRYPDLLRIAEKQVLTLIA